MRRNRTIDEIHTDTDEIHTDTNEIHTISIGSDTHESNEISWNTYRAKHEAICLDYLREPSGAPPSYIEAILNDEEFYVAASLICRDLYRCMGIYVDMYEHVGTCKGTLK